MLKYFTLRYLMSFIFHKVLGWRIEFNNCLNFDNTSLKNRNIVYYNNTFYDRFMCWMILKMYSIELTTVDIVKSKNFNTIKTISDALNQKKDFNYACSKLNDVYELSFSTSANVVIINLDFDSYAISTSMIPYSFIQTVSNEKAISKITSTKINKTDDFRSLINFKNSWCLYIPLIVILFLFNTSVV